MVREVHKFVKVKDMNKDNLIILYSHKKSEKEKISMMNVYVDEIILTRDE